MYIIFFMLIYIFALIGYFGIGLVLFLHLNTYKFNKFGSFCKKIIKYKKYEFPLDLMCIIFWPLWIFINLTINAFYDD